LEADWSVEIGGEAHVIDANWRGHVDLLTDPHRIDEITEAVRFAPLARALLQINRPQGENKQAFEKSPSPYNFWTVKCDLWEIDDALESCDPYEMNAGDQEIHAAVACYIDLLPRLETSASRLLFSEWHDAEQLAKILALSMRNKELTCARADFAVRSAITETRHGFGITLYLTACGPDHSSAYSTLSKALQALTDILVEFQWPDLSGNPIPLQ